MSAMHSCAMHIQANIKTQEAIQYYVQSLCKICIVYLTCILTLYFEVLSIEHLTQCLYTAGQQICQQICKKLQVYRYYDKPSCVNLAYIIIMHSRTRVMGNVMLHAHDYTLQSTYYVFSILPTSNLWSYAPMMTPSIKAVQNELPLFAHVYQYQICIH